MSSDVLCVICSESAENVQPLLKSFDCQNDPDGHTLHIATYRGLERYPEASQLESYDPKYIIFIKDSAELYGSDFISKLIAPLKKDSGVNFSIPATVTHPDAPHYQFELSFNERKYCIPLCNVITGFSPEKNGIFARHNILAMAMRFEFYRQVQAENKFMMNPVDFNMLASLLRRYPGGAAIAPQCGAYMPRFSNFMELWKLFYSQGKKDAWFNANCKQFQIDLSEKFHSFITLAYYCGVIRMKF